MNCFLQNDTLSYENISIPVEVLNSIKNMPFKNLLYIKEVCQSPKKTVERTDDYTLIYCLTGKGTCETQYGTFKVRSNQFILLPPNEFYNYQAEPGCPWDIYCLHFDGNMIHELNTTLNLKRFTFPTGVVFDNQIVDSWREIFSSLSNGFTNENIAFANLCVYRFISFFLFPNQVDKPIQEEEKEDQLAKSISFMRANVHKRLSVEEIADAFKYSSSHYSVLFKQKTGLSPIEYFIRIKIQRASELLISSNLIIKEIAGEVGYDDPFYFTRIFKKVTGKTPREYKLLNGLGFDHKLAI